MNHNILKLWAINKNTKQYYYLNIGNKKDKYICPDCNKDVIFKNDNIRIYHFAHARSDNPCNHYIKLSETQIHKNAKYLIKSLLENKIKLSFIRKCINCKNNNEIKIPQVTELSQIYNEYRFEYNGLKIIDVAHIIDDIIICIFEICNTHKTNDENRSEPLFEIDALTILNLVNNNIITEYKQILLIKEIIQKNN